MIDSTRKMCGQQQGSKYKLEVKLLKIYQIILVIYCI